MQPQREEHARQVVMGMAVVGHGYEFYGSRVLHRRILNHEAGGLMIRVNVKPRA